MSKSNHNDSKDFEEKAKELVEQLGVLNAIYLVDSVLIVIEDYNNLEDINDWKQVRNELLIRELKI